MYKLPDEIPSGKAGISASLEEQAQEMDCIRSCSIEIRNYHKQLCLVNPHYYLNAGECHMEPPAIIQSGFANVFSFRKVEYSIKGSVGAMTYNFELAKHHTGIASGTHRGLGFIAQPTPLLAAIKQESKKSVDTISLYMMWSVPIATKYLHAVGIGPSVSSHRDLFETMYYSKEQLNFKREKGKRDIEYKGIVDGINVTIKAEFSTNVNAQWIIEIR